MWSSEWSKDFKLNSYSIQFVVTMRAMNALKLIVALQTSNF